MFYNIHRHTHTHTDTHARTHTLLLLPSDRAHESLCFECGSSPSPRPTLTWLTPPPTSRSRPGSAPEALGLTLHALRANGLPDSAGKLALLGGDGFLCPRRGCTATGLRGRREEAAQEPQRPTGAAWATTAETQSAQAPRRPACKLTAQRGSLGPCKHLHPQSTPGRVNIFKIAEELANLKDSFHNSQEKFSQAKKLQRLIHLTKKKISSFFNLDGKYYKFK